MSWVAIYTDASWDPTNNMAACGFIIAVEDVVVSKQVVIMDNIKAVSIAERFAILYALEEAVNHTNRGDRLRLYTDQLKFLYEVKKDQGNGLFKIRVQSIMSLMKFNGVKFSMTYIKSHEKQEFKNNHHIHHDAVDVACITELRKFQKENLAV